MLLKRRFATRSSIARSYNYSVLTQAIASGNVARAIAVMDGSPELINDTDKFGNSALHVAVQLESDVMVRELIARGASIDEKNCLGFSPLAWATKIGWKVGMKLMAPTELGRASAPVAQDNKVNLAVSERTYKKLRYKAGLLLSLVFLLCATYWCALFLIDAKSIFIDAREMVNHGAPTYGVVTSIYEGTSATGWMRRSYRTATVTYLDGYKIYINGDNLREGEAVYLTYSELHPHMAKVRSSNDSFLEYAAWRSGPYWPFIPYLTVIAVMWGIWVGCFWSYRKGTLLSASDLNDFFAQDKLASRILSAAGFRRHVKKPVSKSKETRSHTVGSISTAESRPETTKTLEDCVADDIPNRLRQLQALLHEGLISEAEFDEKKRELLRRL